MVLFLAINTASVTLLPTTIIAIRTAAGSAAPAAIVPTALFASICSTAVAIVAAKLLGRFSPAPRGISCGTSADLPAGPGAESATAPIAADPPGYPGWVSAVPLG